MDLVHLVTLRAGELAFDPVYNKLIPLEEEAVKIQGTHEAAHPWHCVYHNYQNAQKSQRSQGCGLHPLRPAQCKALFCADTTELALMYHEDRAQRADIFSQKQGWLELAEAHEEQCPLRPVAEHAQRLYFESHESAEEAQHLHTALLQSLRYDLAFRELCVEKGNIDPKYLPCLLGRPLHIFLPSVGFEVQRDAQNSLFLKKRSQAPYFS